MNTNKYILRALISIVLFASCDSLLNTELPSLASRDAVYTDAGLVRAAANGLYTQNFTNSNTALFRYELPAFISALTDDVWLDYLVYDALKYNTYTSTETNVVATFWKKPYQAILLSNDLLEQLPATTVIPDEEKSIYIGEAKYFRAYFYFILTYLYGDVPFITSTDPNITAQQGKLPHAEVVEKIIEDLKDAETALKASSNDNTKITSVAASALLARIYLYEKNYGEAEKRANEIITTSGYELEDDVDHVFLRSSTESILKIASTFGSYSGRVYLATFTNNNRVNLTEDLLNSFEEGDLRKQKWTTPKVVSGVEYIRPFKYHRYAATSPGEEEDLVLLRLTEQYLIRAEARAQQNKLTGENGAIADLNRIRTRAGLTDLPETLTKEETLLAVETERRHELFFEENHRWWDLVRTGRIDAVLGNFQYSELEGGQKKKWESYRSLLPIPEKEIGNNRNLNPQNPGYK
jgi:hypothetical protein